ncbi:hypothetical protein ABB02_00256 [Clostridiaceae bacterium JG1575]|nr:hypothetical protein ABB02_00256 [Clostridiaceae bacterium JG1575]
MRAQIEVLQKKLRLSKQLLEIYPLIEADTHEKFLLTLLEKLSEERSERTKLRNLKNAGFDTIKSLNGYDYSQIHFPDRLDKERLESLAFLEDKENLILYGGVGTGKTHLAVALGIQAIHQGKKVMFYRIQNLVNTMESDVQRQKVIKKVEAADLVILDEWGYLPLHQDGARNLFDIVSRCYEKKSLIVTTNMEFGRWKSFLFDERLTAAIVDRLVHHSHMFVFAGESYRLSHSLMK